MRAHHLALVPTVAVLLACNSDGTGPDPDALLDVLFNYCSTPPAFAAIQTSEGGPWTAIGTPDATGKVTVQLPSTFGVLEVFQSGSFYTTNVYYMSRDELAIPTTCPLTTTKTVTGSITPALTSGQEAQITIDNRSAFLSAGATTTFQITNVRNGAMDLLAQRRTGTNLVTDKVVVRRAENPTAGTPMAAIDFAAAPAPASATLTITGLTSVPTGVLVNAWTTNNGRAFFNTPSPSSTSATIYGLPAASTIATDRHSVGVYVMSISSDRGTDVYRNAMGNVTVDVGPALSTPTVTVSSSTPTKRMRVQLPSQADYDALVEFLTYQTVSGSTKFVSVVTTAAYFAGTPATWDVTVPDFSTITGFPAAAQQTSAGTNHWEVYAYGETTAWFKAPVDVADGIVHKWAAAYSSTALREMPGAAMRTTSGGPGRRGPGAPR